jgi:hypothetical protein
VSDEALILVPLGTELLALTRRELDAARTRARELGLGGTNGETQVEQLVDSEQLAAITNLPQSWLEEAARQSRIPSVVAGKYRRFRPSVVISALPPNPGATDRDHHARQRRKSRRSAE